MVRSTVFTYLALSLALLVAGEEPRGAPFVLPSLAQHLPLGPGASHSNHASRANLMELPVFEETPGTKDGAIEVELKLEERFVKRDVLSTVEGFLETVKTDTEDGFVDVKDRIEKVVRRHDAGSELVRRDFESTAVGDLETAGVDVEAGFVDVKNEVEQLVRKRSFLDTVQGFFSGAKKNVQAGFEYTKTGVEHGYEYTKGKIEKTMR